MESSIRSVFIRKKGKESEYMETNMKNNSHIKGTENLIVHKSRPLLSLGQSGMTLGEFKILDAYLARINPLDPEKRMVVFKKEEIENLLGVKRIRREELEKRLDNLMQIVQINDKAKPDGFVKIALFSLAAAKKDEDGLWTVKLSCSPETMEYIFNIDQIGYLRYTLGEIKNLQSRYSYLTYLYIQDNRFRRKWQESLDVFKAMLKCDNPCNEEFKIFNRDVLKPCCEMINKLTECKYSYTPVRQGRKVVAIEFTVEDIPYIDYKEAASISEEMETRTENVEQENKLYAAVVENSFSDEEMNIIIKKLKSIPEEKLPRDKKGIYSITFIRYKFLKEKYREIKKTETENGLGNRFERLMSLLEIND